MNRETEKFFLTVVITLMLYMVFSLLWVVFLTKAVNADERPTITISAVYVPGTGGMTEVEAKNAIAFARADYAYQLGLELKVIKWKRTLNIFNRNLDLQSRKDRLRKWQGWFRRYDHSRVDAHFVILPPMQANGLFWIAGMAEGICRPGGVAYGDLELRNLAGDPRFGQSALIIEHELGHLFGASHTVGGDGCDVMDAGALTCSVQRMAPLPWTALSRAQIWRCLN